MRIICPECGFERELDPSQVPATAVMATCPQCELRFRFRSLPAPPLPSDDPNRTRPPLLSDLEAPEQAASPQVAQQEQVQPEHTPVTGHSQHGENGDDPLPPGAIIPSLRRAEADMDAQSERHIAPEPVQKQALKRDAAPQENTRTEDAGEKPSDAPARNDDTARTPGWRERSLFSGSGASTIAWETAKMGELPAAWYHTMLRVLFSAQAFFTAAGESRAGLVRPCLFFVLLGTFQSVVDHLWFMSRLTDWAAMQDANVQAGISAFSQGLNLPLVILFMPMLLLLQMLFYAGLFNLMIRLVQPDKADFITTVRVIAYSAAPGVLSLVPVVGTQVAGLWFAVSCFIGCKYALDLKWSRTAMAILPLYVLGLALSLHAMRMLMTMAQG